MKSICLAVVFLAAMVYAPAQSSKMVLISYFSKTGHTQRMAEEVAKGASSIQGVKVVVKPIDKTDMKDLLKADAVIIGSPVHNSNVAAEVMQFINNWPFENKPLKDKLGAVFVTAGGISSGEELAQVNLLHTMMVFGMVVMGGDDWTSAFGASAVTEEGAYHTDQHKIDKHFLNKGFSLGKRVADWTLKVR